MATTIDNEQLGRLIHEHEIKRTLNAWAHALDFGRFDEFMDCYAEGATMEVFSRGHPFSDREEFRRFVDMNVAQGAHMHVVCTPHVELDRDKAHVTSYVIRLDPWGATKEPIIRAFAFYHDDFIHCDDGRWRIIYRYIERVAFNMLGIDPNARLDIHPAILAGN